MSNYTKTTDFEAKDSLPTGDSGKIIRGAEFETEFDAIATAVATKADTAGPTFTGTLTFDTISDGTISIGAFVDEDNMSSNSAVLVPTQQSVKAYVDAQVTAQDLDFQGDSGGALSIDLDSETMTIAGGTGINTSGSGNTLTISVDSSISTLSGSDTLTNKNIDVDNNTVTNLEVSNFKATAVVIESEGIGSNDNDTTLPTSAAVKDYVDSQTTAQDLDFQADSGGALSIDLDSEAITFTGGTGIDTSGSDNAVTFAIDSTVTTLTDTQTLTNKTLTAPVISGNLTTDGTIDGRDVATDGSKLDGIEALADVTDTTNVTAAGALMDSELTNLTAVKSLDQGVATTDTPTFAGLATTADVSFADNDKAVFGAGSDLQIYHDGSNSYVKDAGTGQLILQGSTKVILKGVNGDNFLQGNEDGAVNLYYNDSQKLATTSTGIDVTGTVTADDLTIDGAIVVNSDTTTAITATQNANTDVNGLMGIRINNSTGTTYAAFGNSGADSVAITAGDAGGTGNTSLTFKTAASGSEKSRLNIGSGGDISFYEDTGTTAKLVWKSADERLGIGTSSPVAKFDVVMGAGNRLLFTTTGSDTFVSSVNEANNAYSNLFINGAVTKLGTGGTERMRIDSSGNLLVNKTSADNTSQGVTIYGSTAPGAASFVRDSGNTLVLNRLTTDGEILALRKDGTTVGSIGTAGGDLTINGQGGIGVLQAGGTGQFAWASNLFYPITDNAKDLGTSSFRFKDLYLSGTANTGGLTVNTTNGSSVFEGTGISSVGLQFKTNASNRYLIQTPSATADLAFLAGGTTEVMRLDSSGNLLVGKTAVGSTVDGFEARASGYTALSDTSGAALNVNRNTTDGNIVTFTKDGSTVGSIGTDLSRLFIGSDDSMIFFDAGSTNAIWPWKSTATSDGDADNTIDIGDSTNRFKDLYLSGGVYLGGTAAANKLDDYEEGTWTPEYSAATAFTSVTYDGVRYGKYTKVGNLVHIQGILRTDAVNGGSGTVTLTGLPFTVAAAEFASVSVGYVSGFAGDHPSGIYVLGGGTSASIRYRTTVNGGLDGNLAVGDLNTGGNSNYLIFAGTYITTA